MGAVRYERNGRSDPDHTDPPADHLHHDLSDVLNFLNTLLNSSKLHLSCGLLACDLIPMSARLTPMKVHLHRNRKSQHLAYYIQVLPRTKSTCANVSFQARFLPAISPHPLIWPSPRPRTLRTLLTVLKYA